jgi:hypothetical protein
VAYQLRGCWDRLTTGRQKPAAQIRARSDFMESSFPRKREPRASDEQLPCTAACAGVTNECFGVIK